MIMRPATALVHERHGCFIEIQGSLAFHLEYVLTQEQVQKLMALS